MESELVTCPYNKTHKICHHRMPAHLIKCKKNYKGEPLQACPFNATHLFKPSEMAGHLGSCGDYHASNREKYEKYYENNDLEN